MCSARYSRAILLTMPLDHQKFFSETARISRSQFFKIHIGFLVLENGQNSRTTTKTSRISANGLATRPYKEKRSRALTRLLSVLSSAVPFHLPGCIRQSWEHGLQPLAGVRPSRIKSSRPPRLRAWPRHIRLAPFWRARPRPNPAGPATAEPTPLPPTPPGPRTPIHRSPMIALTTRRPWAEPIRPARRLPQGPQSQLLPSR